jgi:putative hydrolase of the HAD superfamily
MLNLRYHFDDMHYTAQLGASKSSQALYAPVERHVGLRPSAIAFVDDDLANFQAARMRGWNAALWTPGSRLHTLIPALSTWSERVQAPTRRDMVH